MESSSPTLKRRELGARLRQLRHDAGMTVEEVAAELLCSPAKVSRMETARRGISLRDVRDLCGIYDVDRAVREELMSMAQDSHQHAWWQEFDVPYQKYIGLEEAAASIVIYESGAVPSLFQTADYARALIIGTDPTLLPDQVDQGVEARMIRQQLLTAHSAKTFHAVLDEAAVRRLVGGAEVMQAQLSALAQRAVLPNVTIQLIPFEAGAHPGLDSTFTILQFTEESVPDVVYVEGLLGQFYVERKAEIERYNRSFERIRAKALTPHDTVARLATMIGA